jgi:putative transposase
MKVVGRLMYLYRAIDSVGNPVGSFFGEHRDLVAAKCLIGRAMKRHGQSDRIAIDGSQTKRVAIAVCDGESRLRDRSRRKRRPDIKQ